MGLASVRSADVAAVWRDLVSKDRGFRLTSLRFEEKPPFRDQEADLPNGMTVICGLNGVGKITALRLLEATLNGSDTIAGRVRSGLVEVGQFAAGIERDGKVETIDMGGAVPESSALLLDAYRLCNRIRQAAAEPNFNDLLEGVEPHVFEPAELERANYLVGRAYDELLVFEVEDPLDDGGEATLPIFRARVGVVEYEVLDMGLGELAGLEALWQIDHAPPGTVFLVEEPETFLSSRSTAALLDLLVQAITDRRLYAVVATHAPEAVAQCPLDAIRLLTPSPDWGSIELSSPRNRAELEYTLQMGLGQARVVLAEDKTAVIFIADLLGRYGGAWGRSIEVRGVGGEAVVRSLCSGFPESHVVRLVGVLDGDQQIAEQPRWPLLKLPIKESPDTCLRKAAVAEAEVFARSLARPSDDVAKVTARLEGVDDHDWFPDVAAALFLMEPMVMQAAIGCWLHDEENSRVAEQFVVAVSEAVMK